MSGKDRIIEYLKRLKLEIGQLTDSDIDRIVREYGNTPINPMTAALER